MRATQIEGTTSDSKMNVIEIYEAIIFFLFFLFFFFNQNLWKINQIPGQKR